MSDPTPEPAPADHFGGHAAAYAAHRPTYPAELYARITAGLPAGAVAWDCATGNGQAARGLAVHVGRVVATDLSENQLAAAPPHPRVDYVAGLAEAAPIRDGTVDLVTVAQALHWFDRPRFFAEVRRVVRPGGRLAVWTYGLHRIAPQVDAVVARYYREVVGQWWPPERRHVEAGYAGIEFPWAMAPVEGVIMAADWTRHELLGYLGTWSATRRAWSDRGADPREAIAAELIAAWPDPEVRRRVEWPLTVLVGTVA